MAPARSFALIALLCARAAAMPEAVEPRAAPNDASFEAMPSAQPHHALHCPKDTASAAHLMSKHAAVFAYDAEHHLGVAMKFLCKLSGGPATLAGKTIMELGYGQAPVLGVIARGLHARSYSVEYSNTPWLSALHIPFYEALHARLARVSRAKGTLGESFNSHAAMAWARSCGRHRDAGMQLLTTSTEVLEGVPDGSIDVSVSNAVFEHISDVNATFAALARVSRLGSLTCHQVDLRHHKNFTRPWDFLLTPEHQWRAEDGLHSGNRLRLQEFLDAAHYSGWQTVEIQFQHEPVSEAGRAYAARTLQRLRNCAHCKYQHWPRRDLDGCTANGMPMTSVFFCAELVGRAAVHAEPARGPCGVDYWMQEGYSRLRRGRRGFMFNSSSNSCI